MRRWPTKVSGKSNRHISRAWARIGQGPIARRAEAFRHGKIGYHSRRPSAGEVVYDYYNNVLDPGARRRPRLLVLAWATGGKEDRGASPAGSHPRDGWGKDRFYLIKCIARLPRSMRPRLVDALVRRGGSAGRRPFDVFAAEPRVPEALLKLDNVGCCRPHVFERHGLRLAPPWAQLVVDNLAAWFARKPLLTQI